MKMHLMEVWQQLMYILVEHLGATQEETPFYSKSCKQRAELLFERILKEGTSRISEEKHAEGAPYLKRKWMTFQSRLADSRLVKPYAPHYARHKTIGDVMYGIERMLKCK